MFAFDHDMNVKLSTFAVSLLLIVPTWLYLTLSWRLPKNRQQQQQNAGSNTGGPPSPSPSRTRTYLSAFIALHAVYILYQLFFCAPVNMFSALRLPINAAPDVVRETLLGLTGEDMNELPAPLEVLLKRLNSFDARTYYVRFGHDALLKCQHCVAFYDYALFALPRPLLEYVREVAVAGFVTTRRSGRLRWRKFAVGILVLAALTEAYLTLTKAVVVGEYDGTKTTMLHDRLWLGRHLLFFVLPPVLFLLPPSHDSASLLATSLPQLALLADQTLARIHLLKYSHGAAARSPLLRDRVTEWWAREQAEGEWGTQDEEVKKLAAELGMEFNRGGGGGESGEKEAGELRKKAGMAVEGLKGGFRPSEFMQT